MTNARKRYGALPIFDDIAAPRNFLRGHAARASGKRHGMSEEFPIRSSRDQVLEQLDFVIARHLAIARHMTTSGPIETARVGR